MNASRTRFTMLLLTAALLVIALAVTPAGAFADDLPAPVPSVDGVALEASAASGNHDGAVTVSEKADAVTLDGCAFGIESFGRQNKGTDKLYDDEYYGYRWPLPSRDSFSVIVAEGYLIVHIDQGVVDSLGIDVESPSFQQDFITMLTAVDDAAANGGPRFSTMSDEAVYFTTADAVEAGDYTYRFGVEVEDGYYYTTSTLAGSQTGGGGGIYAESGMLGNASDIVVVEKPTGMAALRQFFDTLDWSPLWVSLKTTGTAIVIISVLGLLAAWLTVKVSSRVKGILDTVFTIPMVLPPTVCGFLLLVFFGTSTAVGRWFIAHGIDIVFTWPAAVISCVVVGFPLMYRTARGAFENLDPSMLDAARTLGWSETRVFLRIMFPLAWPSIAAGIVLAFARALGEFGCTLFFASNYVGVTQTIPIAIYFDWMGGNTSAAIFWVIVVIVISFLVILFINVHTTRVQRYRRGDTVDEPGD